MIKISGVMSSFQRRKTCNVLIFLKIDSILMSTQDRNLSHTFSRILFHPRDGEIEVPIIEGFYGYKNYDKC